ncbi:translocation/assembly module TamB domain-containing protein [Paracoccus albus]|uniref:translocation/assembly module TamB domain-containing protein n=1 Tax=Paracoccus albus TaxID=3017784 RepID=UPI0022F00DB0|nr:translocation/assembly module TamB domain-containing protein [Paracoccus albus]WBU59986.1 translocation/assembly module TamB domain-containing protein [Paracoccus albus]
MLQRVLIFLALVLLLPFSTSAQETVDEDATIAEIAAEESSDEGFLTRVLQSRLSGAGRSVDIQGFRGALSSRATFDRITIADAEGTWLTLEDGAIQWTRSALLRGRVEIGELSAARIEIPRGPGGEAEEEQQRTEARSFNLPELPVGINIEQIDADSVILGEELLGEEAVVSVTGSMSLAGGEGIADVVINRTDGKKGDFTFNGSFDNESRVLDVDLSLDEDPEGIFSRIARIEGRPAVTAEIHGEGPLSDYAATIQIATDGEPRITGEVSFAAAEDEDGTAGNDFNVQIGGDLATLLPPDNRAFFGNETQLLAQGFRAASGRLELEALSLDTDALKINGRLATNDQRAPQMLDLTIDFGEQAGATALPVTIPFVDPPVTVQSGNLAIGYDARQGSDWSLNGWLTAIDREGVNLSRLDLDGQGQVVLAEGDSLDQINGSVGFDASGLQLADEKLQRVVGDSISGRTGFDFAPGQVLELTEMAISGTDYGLEGRLTVDGLSSGIVLSTDEVIATHSDLSNISELAGRSLSGSATADLAGYFQVLTGAFDLDGTVTGTDLRVDNEQLDHLLQGNSTIELSAGRTEEGTELRDLSINAQRISLTASGTATNDNLDLTADFSVPTLADLDPDLDGALSANARIVGAPGARQVILTGDAAGLQTGITALDGAFAGETSLDAELQEGADGFSLTALQLQNGQLDLDGSGAITGGEIDANFDLTFKDLGALGERFSGILDAQAQITGGADGRNILITGTGEDIAVGQDNVDGLLVGETQINLQATQSGAVITLSDARVTNEQLSMTAAGSFGASGTSANARLEIPSLAPMGSGWQGALNADAVVTQGADGQRQINVDAVGQDLALGQQNVDGALVGQTDITMTAEQTAAGVLRLQSLDISNPQLAAQASGELVDGRASGQAAAQIANLAALGQGWSGSLDATAQLATDQEGTRRVEIDGTGQNIKLGQAQADAALTGITTIDIAAAQRRDGAIDIERANITNDQLTATAQGQIGQDGTDATGSLDVRDLASLGLGLQGALDVDAVFADTGDGARRLTVTGTGEDLALGQRGNAGTLTGTTDIDVAALERDGTYTIERATLTNDQTRINAEGSIGPGGTDARADLDISDLSALGLGMAGAVTAEASVQDTEAGGQAFSVTGTATDLALRQAGEDRALQGETRFVANGSLNEGVVTLDSAQIDNPQLSANASGVYGPDQTELTARLDASDLSFIGGGVGGAANASAEITDTDDGRVFDVTGSAQDLTIGNAQADAALAGETRLAVRAIQNGSRYEIEQLQAENPQIEVSGQGVLGGGQTRFEGNAGSDDLSFLGQGFGGAVNADATLQTRGGVVEFDISGTGSNIAVGVAQLDAALAGNTSFSATGQQDGALIRLDQATASNDQLNANATGVYGAGQTDITAELSVPSVGFAGGYSGSLNSNARILDVAEGRRITADAVANGLGIGNERVDGLLAGQTVADVALLQTEGGIIVERLNARNPNLQVIADGNPAQGLNVDARLSDLSSVLPGIDGPAQAVGTVQQTEAGTQMDIAVTAPGGTRAQLVGQLAGDATDLRMSGVSDAAAANPFLRTRSVEGPVSFDLRMQGPPDLNSITGNVSMPSGRLAEPRIGLTVDDLRLDAQLERGLIDLDVAGNINAGGSLAVDGAVDLRSGSPVLDLRARLNRAVIRDPNLYELVADGTVSVTGVAADGPLVSGTINIIEAEFRIPSTGLGGAQDIPDIVHVNDNWRIAATRAKAGIEPYGSLAAQAAELSGPAAVPPANPARFDLTINAPNQIFVRGRGVDAELGGSTRLTGDARNPIPIGHLSLIRGRVDLLGKRFDLTEGLVELQGSMIPVIRLVATHTEDDITIRIIIDGEVRDPDITFESDPSLPEEEVLSYLLFGQGLDQISPLQAAQLANALAVLAGQGGIGVVGNIREATGLDDLDMTVDDDGSVAVRAGKYLSRNVYTDVELDDAGKTQINLNLDVTDSLTARGSVDSEGDSTLGLYYERDY